MQKEKEVQILLKNISDSISKTSIRELNDNLTNFLLNKEGRNDEVSIVLKEVCEEFKISIKSLMNPNPRGKIQDAKQTSYCILHNGLNMSMGYISSQIFRNNKRSVFLGICRYRNANMKIHSEKEFVEIVDKIKSSVLEKIKNK
jgi:hypothetical protein